MATVTMRTLSRETKRLLDEISSTMEPVVVTRDGEEVAFLMPMSPVERAMRASLRQQGVDPDSPPPVRHDLEPVPPTPAGEASAFDHLMSERDSYYTDKS